jgi:hypothetical protein
MLCCMCNQPKLPADFYAGNASLCKECYKARVRRRALTNPRVQEYDRARAKTPERREHITRVSRQWRKDHPDAYKANNAVNNAVRDRRLDKEPCSICGTEKEVHGHHKDYSKPLDVIWLCARCHHRIHATFPELGGHFGETQR